MAGSKRWPTKLNRFLLAEDPRNESGDLAIIHTIDPQSIIGVIHEHVEHEQPFRQFTYEHTGEQITLYIHHMFTTNMSAADDIESEKMIDKLLNRAWHWYKSYLEWEDKNLNEQDEAELN